MTPDTIKAEFTRRITLILEEDQSESGCNAVLRLADFDAEWARSPFKDQPQGILSSILTGSPVLVKDNIDTKGLGNTAGSIALSGIQVDSDAPVITQLRKNGGLVLGKTNLSEWANFRSSRSLSGWSSKGRQTLNAFDPGRSPSGSSSGSAVAIAKGYADYAIGTETDGSIISPAAHAGIVGIKPSLGLLDCTGIIPIASSQDTPGPMARTMTGAAKLLQALINPDKSPVHQRIFSNLSNLAPLPLEGLRFGLWLGGETFLQPDYYRIPEALEHLSDTLTRAGAIRLDDESCDPEQRISLRELEELEMEVLLDEFHDEIDHYLQTRRTASPLTTLAELIQFNREHEDRIMPYFGQDIFEQALSMPGKTSQSYRQTRSRLSTLIYQECLIPMFESTGLDVLLMPSNGPAWLRRPGQPEGYSGGTSSLAAVSGWPSLTLPMGTGLHPLGLPIGLSVLTRANQDDQLCAIGLSLESLLAPDGVGVYHPTQKFESTRKSDPKV